ncbi:uncharacterized protein LOC133125826 [Conger conger]|uniref:uncharacterized protein LOC133125826 n=1 Tax=Conger conger TaxID=82655 RepID=UPI002A5AD323|nr:uncharacterized protein LOC133125826 [Conger conger]
MKVDSSDIREGESVNLLCGVPIDYTGGFCRLYRNGEKDPLKTLQTNSYVCEFTMSSHELLAGRPAGTRTTVECDYTLQNYVSMRGSAAVVVWGTAEKPALKISPQVVMLGGRVQVDCEPPRSFRASECMVYRDRFYLQGIPCSHQITAERLMLWQPISSMRLFNEISVNCKYKKEEYIRSDRSNPKKILVIDPSKLQISSDQTNGTFVCEVPARVQDFVLLHTGNKTLNLEMGGKLVLEAINNSTGPFNQTCLSI